MKQIRAPKLIGAQHCRSIKIKRRPKMRELLSVKQIANVFTTYAPTTVRELARKGKLPVALWADHEPMFKGDAQTIRALVSLAEGEDQTNG